MAKFVRFDIWCNYCIHHELEGSEDPCNDCLCYGANEDSTKPVNFKPKKDSAVAEARADMRF